MDLSQSSALKRYQAKQEEKDASKRDMLEAYQHFLEDCHYPVAKDGSIMDASYVVAIVGYHMIRCGWRRSADPLIKPRRVTGGGVVEDAVEWVGVDEPDDPLENLEQMSVRELAELSPQARAEAIRRLGGAYDHDLSEPEPAWQVKPNITITDDPVTGDDLIGGL